MMKAPRRGLRLAEFQLLLFLFLCFLLPDVVADCTAPGSLDTHLCYAAWRSSYSSRASSGV